MEARAPLAWMIGIASVQGFALYGLYRSIEIDVWPATSRTWLVGLLVLAIFVPLVTLLTVTRTNLTRLMQGLGLLSAIIALCGFYTGWAATLPEEPFQSSIATFFSLSIVVGVFHASLYVQRHANNEPLDYSLLFTYSWRTFLTVALSVGFAGGVCLVLALWAALFSTVGVDLFADLFWNDWFLIPVLTTAFGLAVSIFRNLSQVIDSVTRLLEGLIRLLLPLIATVAVMFLATMPFVGLKPLWNTGNGTALLMALTALSLFFVNAVYQSSAGASPYPKAVSLLIMLALLSLPLYSALSFYGLWLRVDAYGWTVGRCWAMVIWLILALFSIGYAAGVVIHRLNWPVMLSKTNVYLGWGVVLLALLPNTPVLDFRSISLSSQVARVAQGEISWSEFDFYYTQHHLGRIGYQHAEELKLKFSNDEDLVKLIEDPPPPVYRAGVPNIPKENIFARVHFSGPNFPIPEEVKRAYRSHGLEMDHLDLLALKVDVTRDEIDDFVLIGHTQDSIDHSVVVYALDGSWHVTELTPVPATTKNLLKSLKGKVRVAPPTVDELSIGDMRFLQSHKR